MSNNNNSGGVGKGILCFVLGFLFAFVVIAGALVGAYFWGMNATLTDIMDVAKIKNDDGNGRPYINTDEDNGGVNSVKALVEKVTFLASDGNIANQSLDELQNLLPFTTSITDEIFESLKDYVTLDKAEIGATKFMDLPMYLEDVIMEVRPAAIMDKVGVSLGDNIVVNALLRGVECKYVYANAQKTIKYPVYFDEYTTTSDEPVTGLPIFNRKQPVNNQDPYPASPEVASEWITATAVDEEERTYRQYFYAVSDGESTTYYMTKADAEGEYIYTDPAAAVQYSADYGKNYMGITGNYYYDNDLSEENPDGKKVEAEPITIRSISNDPFSPLYAIRITDVLGTTGEGGIIADLFKDACLGELIDGKLDFTDMINDITLSDLVNVNADESIMRYLAYRISAYKADAGTDTKGRDYTHTGIYTPFRNGKPIEILDGGVPTGAYVTYPCYVEAESGKIKAAWYYVGEEYTEVVGTKVTDVSGVLSSLKNDLTLGEVINVPADNKILGSFKDAPIGGLAERVADLRVSDVFTEEDLSGSSILNQLRGVKITDLATEVVNLSLQQMYSEIIYGTGAELQLVDSAHFNKYNVYFVTDGNGGYKLAGEASDGKLDAWQEDIYSFGEIQNGIWKVLLCENVEEGGVNHKNEIGYTVSNMDLLIRDSTAKIYSSTLGDLQGAGIIDATLDLTKTFTWSNAAGGHSVRLADMTFETLIEAVVSMSAAMP